MATDVAINELRAAVSQLNDTVKDIRDALLPKLGRSPITCAVCGTLPNRSYYIETYSEDKGLRERICLCVKDYEAMLALMRKAHKELATKG
jgi:hypothetical protein